MDLALKEFIEKNIHLIEQNRFKELYIIAQIDPGFEVCDLTKLLHAAEIYPLKELNFIPAHFMSRTFPNKLESIDLSDLLHIKHIEE